MRYLGSAPDFSGQEETHFRILLAEITAEAVCSRLISRKEADDPEGTPTLTGTLTTPNTPNC